MPKISIVMPVLNGEKMIANAINSILNQTEKDWELIIVVDDASTDNTVEVVQKFDDNRINLIRKSVHTGIVSCRNFGNQLAKADIIAMQDADDLSMPDRLQKCLKVFEAFDPDVLYHGIYTNQWNPNLNCIARGYVPALPFDKERLLKEQYIPGACMFKKKCWIEKPFRLETQHAFDWMMHLDWSLSGYKYYNFDIGLYEYVRHEDSASVTYEKDGRRAESIKKIKEIIAKEYA